MLKTVTSHVEFPLPMSKSSNVEHGYYLNGYIFKDPVGHHSTTGAMSFGLRSEAKLHGATTAFSLTKDVEAVEISAV